MNAKRIAAVMALCALVVLMVGWCCEPAEAANSSTMEKKGVDGLFAGGPEIDKDRLPSKVEMGLGIGSIFVMIAVVKYL